MGVLNTPEEANVVHIRIASRNVYLPIDFAILYGILFKTKERYDLNEGFSAFLRSIGIKKSAPNLPNLPNSTFPMPIVTPAQLRKLYTGIARVKPRLVGLDVGTTNVGVALSDPTLKIALPQMTLLRKECMF